VFCEVELKWGIPIRKASWLGMVGGAWTHVWVELLRLIVRVSVAQVCDSVILHFFFWLGEVLSGRREMVSLEPGTGLGQIWDA
jgi:hypothetical protein